MFTFDETSSILIVDDNIVYKRCKNEYRFIYRDLLSGD